MIQLITRLEEANIMARIIEFHIPADSGQQNKVHTPKATRKAGRIPE